MNGTKSRSDGDIRLDVPGGWPGDKVSHFTREGRDEIQNEAFDFMSALLHWRQGNNVIAYGDMKHYVLQKGVYVYERYIDNDRIIVFMNGTSNDVEINLSRYSESIMDRNEWVDFLSGDAITLGQTLKLSPKEILILE